MRTHFILLILAISLFAGEVAAQNQRFTRSTATVNEPVVTDTATGLLWQGCVAGKTGDVCAAGTAATYDWTAALAYCETLTWGGVSDWRLPNKKELHGITDKNRYNPAIDVVAFPATPASWFWSSSSLASSEDDAWDVAFSYGYVNDDGKSDGYHRVRCVRGGP